MEIKNNSTYNVCIQFNSGTSPEQVDFIVVELGPVVSEPPGAALTSDLPRLPYSS